ncbi:acetyl-CoA carboxylase biotin carboxyl carrier protein [Bacilli bacterium PM5-3]|nr:acetyl-CoA carboxylase biotin carboxyl carrier protein [Bacilli bacterium PM5-3]
MDIEKVKELINILEESQLECIEIKENDFEIKLLKPTTNVVEQVINPKIVNEIKEEVSIKKDLNTIDSPLVGTFYSKPAPDAKKYVNINQSVNVGDVICIIEAMKVMNEIRAEKSGVIKEILVDDEVMVEFGQPLFVIE